MIGPNYYRWELTQRFITADCINYSSVRLGGGGGINQAELELTHFDTWTTTATSRQKKPEQNDTRLAVRALK